MNTGSPLAPSGVRGLSSFIHPQTLLEDIFHGYSGFMPLTNAERQANYRDRKRGGPPQVRKAADCPDAYQAHRKRGEDPCQECKDVWAARYRVEHDYLIPGALADRLLSGSLMLALPAEVNEALAAGQALRRGDWYQLRVTMSRRPARAFARALQAEALAVEDKRLRKSMLTTAAHLHEGPQK